MANVLKKIVIASPLPLLGLHTEQEIYNSLQSDEEIAAFYHKLLDVQEAEEKAGFEKPLKKSMIHAMIAASTGKNINAQMLLL
ncbi:MAG: hypothetical protein CME35_01275 [Gramella sp.]|nr:hypothetical protein [Christiangramia sp.]MAY34452.1 hypothetical protein [Rhodovulum sp.]|tara:strand:+ start:400 stop:648 length:249 start_codon:yes stop_codon:yes gene_type:complete